MDPVQDRNQRLRYANERHTEHLAHRSTTALLAISQDQHLTGFKQLLHVQAKINNGLAQCLTDRQSLRFATCEQDVKMALTAIRVKL